MLGAFVLFSCTYWWLNTFLGYFIWSVFILYSILERFTDRSFPMHLSKSLKHLLFLLLWLFLLILLIVFTIFKTVKFQLSPLRNLFLFWTRSHIWMFIIPKCTSWPFRFFPQILSRSMVQFYNLLLYFLLLFICLPLFTFRFLFLYILVISINCPLKSLLSG